MVNDDARRTPPTGAASGKGRGIAGRTLYAGLDTWSQQLCQLVTFIFVGNVLGPELVGVFVSALLYHLFVSELFLNSFSEAVVQKKDITREHHDAVFWFSIGLGLVVTVLSLLLAEVIAAAFGRQEIAGIVRGLAIIYPLLSVSSYCVEVLRRKMNFRWLALRSALSGGAATLVAIVFVKAGYGIWSLVAYHVCWRVCEFAILLVVTEWRPRLRFSMARLREVSHYGFHAMGLNVVGYLASHFDKVIVGMFLGPLPLGIYMMGNRVVRALSDGMAGVFFSVSFPIFARLQGHKRVFERAFANATQLSNLLGLPVFVGLAIVAEPLVAAVLKPEWAPLVPILRIFCISGSLMTVIYIQAAAMRALGEVHRVFRWELLLTTARLATLLLVGRFGLMPVAVTATVFPLAALPIWQTIINRKLKSNTAHIFMNFLPALWSCAAMAAVTVAVSELIVDHVFPVVHLAVMVLVGAIGYFSCLAVTSPSSVKLVRSILRTGVPRAL